MRNLGEVSRDTKEIGPRVCVYLLPESSVDQIAWGRCQLGIDKQ